MPMDRQKCSGICPAKYHKSAAANAMAMTAGTNTALIRSANREMGALEEAASSINCTICDSVVSLPTRVARNSR